MPSLSSAIAPDTAIKLQHAQTFEYLGLDTTDPKTTPKYTAVGPKPPNLKTACTCMVCDGDPESYRLVCAYVAYV